MSKANDTHSCTCPSGDGSLRWPCPIHMALPKPAHPAQFIGHGGEQSSNAGYSAEQMRAYAAQAVAAQTPADPMNWPLPCDVTVGHGTMRKGVKLSTLVLRMKALYKMATGEDADEVAARSPEVRARMLAAFQAQIGAKPLVCDSVHIADSGKTATPALPATEDSSAGDLAEPVHPDDAAVDALAVKMKAKLAMQRAKGYGGWNTPECSQQRLSDMLRYHVTKGDPVDVANFCAFLDWRGEGVAAESQDEPVANLTVHMSEFDAGEIRKAAIISMIWKSVKELPLGDYQLYTAPQAQPADAWAHPTGRLYTYAKQPNNHEAWRIGEACHAAQPGGDPIDHGLSLLQKLQDKGYGIFSIDDAMAAAQAQPADALDVKRHS